MLLSKCVGKNVSLNKKFYRIDSLEHNFVIRKYKKAETKKNAVKTYLFVYIIIVRTKIRILFNIIILSSDSIESKIDRPSKSLNCSGMNFSTLCTFDRLKRYQSRLLLRHRVKNTLCLKKSITYPTF